MPEGVKLYIVKELGIDKYGKSVYRLRVKKNGLDYGFMTAHVDHKKDIGWCYPARKYRLGNYLRIPYHVTWSDLTWEK